MSTPITCPACRHVFELSEAMQAQVASAARLQAAAELEQVRAEVEQRAARSLAAKEAELEGARKQVGDAAKREAELMRRERLLGEQAAAQALEVERKVTEEAERIRALARKEADERLARELLAAKRAREEELGEERKRTNAARERELALLAHKRELEEKAASQEVELARRLDAERTTAREAAKLAIEEERRLAQERKARDDAEHEEKTRQLEKKFAELQQRFTQGSMQVQGEAQEVQLRNLLADAFRDDRIEDVPKGVLGADLLQRVLSEDRRDCGTIIWESKRTQNWSEGWLQKLRDDKRAAGASLAVIVSQALPPGVRSFSERDGVWICGWSYAVPVASLLRGWLADVASSRLAGANADTKGQRLYAYLTGQEFRNRFDGIVEAYVSMRTDLDAEQRAMLAIWRKREGHLKRARASLAAFYGDVRAISGASMQALARFELSDVANHPALGDGEDDDDDVELVAGEADPKLVELLFSLLPADGSSLGNGAMLKQLEEAAAARLGRLVSAADYEAAKAALLRDGKLRKGRGRGGSVMRCVSGEADAP